MKNENHKESTWPISNPRLEGYSEGKVYNPFPVYKFK